MHLKEKVVFITGAGSGIGKAIAHVFAENGASVVVAEIVEERGRRTVDEISRKNKDALFVKLDVSNIDDIDTGVEKAISHFGKIDILVNNAAILEYKPFLHITEGDWDRLIGVNLKGAFFCAQKVASRMIEDSIKGCIINLSSIASEFAIEFQSHYAISKGGIRMMTKALALELAPHGIRVNAIAPGIILTDMTKEDLEEPTIREEALKKVPLGRLGDPEDVAKVALFLASDDANYITGSMIYTTGGMEIVA